jgi:DnaA family protein
MTSGPSVHDFHLAQHQSPLQDVKQIALSLSEGPVPSLQNFVPGDNAPAMAALHELLAGQSQRTVYLWGPPATGKSHLLTAVSSQLTARGQTFGWMKADSHDGSKDFTWEPASFDPQWSMVLLDDVDSFSLAQQQQAFAWLIHAQSAACPVLATGLHPPADLPLRDDVRSRLAWGNVYSLQALSEPDCKRVLRESAHARGIELSDEVVDFVMHRFSRDLGSLMLLLDMLDRYALENKRAVTVPLVTAMLRSL